VVLAQHAAERGDHRRRIVDDQDAQAFARIQPRRAATVDQRRVAGGSGRGGDGRCAVRGGIRGVGRGHVAQDAPEEIECGHGWLPPRSVVGGF
jgi:hypothetical protein